MIKPGESVTLSVSISVTQDTQSFFSFGGATQAYFDQADIKPGSVTRSAISFYNADKKYYFEANRKTPSSNGDVTAQPRGGSKAGDRMALLTTFSMQVAMGTAYIYEWQPVN